MKIVVHNNSEQYALSRKQLEGIATLLPNAYFHPIREFHLTHTRHGAEIFEYHAVKKICVFCNFCC